MPEPTARPVNIQLHQLTRKLEIDFDDNSHFELSCEFLRVYSPSAEVQGHGNPVLQVNKADVNIIRIEPVGHYAVRLVFSDGHDTGLYSWDYLYRLGQQQQTLWQEYLQKLALLKCSQNQTSPHE